jgi:hypothetical protein
MSNRSELTLWAIRRAKEIVEHEGAELALAARVLEAPAIEEASTLLATEITKALLEAYERGHHDWP